MRVPVSASSNAGSRAVASRDPDNAEVRLQRRMDGAPGQHSTVISPPVAVVNLHQRGLEPSNGRRPRVLCLPCGGRNQCQCFSAFWHVRRWYASEARSGVEVLLQMRRLSTEIPRFSTGIASLPRHQESHLESTTPPCTSYLVLGRTLKSKSASSRHLHCISKANSTLKLAYLTWPGARADDGRRLCGEDAGQGRLTPTWLALALAQTYRPPGS